MLLSPEDWIEFGEMYPGAEAWIISRSLRRERELLEAETARGFDDPRRALWVRARLAELRGDTDDEEDDDDEPDCAECARSWGPNYTGPCPH